LMLAAVPVLALLALVGATYIRRRRGVAGEFHGAG
jgi:hypothetical protein